MSFTVQLTPDLAPVEPGATTPITVAVHNRSSEMDRYELEIEGIDPEWKAVPVPEFAVDAGDSHQEKVFFKPRRSSESLAGNYPFVVRVRSLITGEQKTIQGVLQVKPFHHVSLEISPKKGFVSPARKQFTFYVTIVNLGNTEHTLQLVGSDPEDAGAYDFEHEQVTVAPGQQRDVEMYASPTSQPIFSGPRLVGFNVTGRSVDVPSVVGSTQAQLEQRSLLSPTSLIIMLILALLLGAWLAFMPKPPTISLNVDRLQVMRGDTVTLSWVAERATEVAIFQGDSEIHVGSELRGTRTITLTQPGQNVTFSAVARRNGNETRASRTVTILEPEPVPPPQIISMSAEPQRIRLGESFILRYRFNPAVERALLQPVGTELNPALNEIEITPNRDGVVEYTIVAMNRRGDRVESGIRVTVVDESDARIPIFRAQPTDVVGPTGMTSLSWLVTGAVRAELQVNNQTLTVENSGSQSFQITQNTTFTLTAYDDRGRSVSRKLVVNYTEPIPPPLPTTGDTGTTTTTGTTDGTTTGTGGTLTGATGGQN
jgi:hypothetical protein